MGVGGRGVIRHTASFESMGGDDGPSRAARGLRGSLHEHGR